MLAELFGNFRSLILAILNEFKHFVQMLLVSKGPNFLFENFVISGSVHCEHYSIAFLTYS